MPFPTLKTHPSLTPSDLSHIERAVIKGAKNRLIRGGIGMPFSFSCKYNFVRLLEPWVSSIGFLNDGAP